MRLLLGQSQPKTGNTILITVNICKYLRITKT